MQTNVIIPVEVEDQRVLLRKVRRIGKTTLIKAILTYYVRSVCILRGGSWQTTNLEREEVFLSSGLVDCKCACLPRSLSDK